MTPLQGFTALVAGATGEVGRGAAFALSEAGSFVYLAGRSADKLKAVQESLPFKEKSEIIALDYSTVEGAKELAAKVDSLPNKLDVVIASSGPFWRMTKIATEGDIDTIYKATQANFNSHLFLYNALASKMNPKGQYLMVNGAAARNIVGTGITGVMAHAVTGAAKLMNDECINNQDTLPDFTHVLLSASVGHGQFRGTTNDPNEFGKSFVAMALNKHVDLKDEGTLDLTDAMHDKLTAKL